MSPRILTLDIETSPMKVWTFSLFKPFIGYEQIIEDTRMLCWAAKWLDEDKILFRSEFHHGRDAMLRVLHDLLDEADIVIHFNGDSFDLPHIRREFNQADLKPFSPLQVIDLYKQIKRSQYYPSYKLANISRQLSVGAKVAHSGFDLWIHCCTESPEDNPNRQKRAWALMRRYNKGDITVTEDLYLDTREWLPGHPNLGIYLDDPQTDRCSVCLAEGESLKPDGFAYTKLGKYPKFQCADCGKYGRSKKGVAFIDLRGLAS